MDYTYEDIAKMIDHSLLRPTLTADELDAGCELALAYDVASVCILPYRLKRCAEILAGSTVRASTTIAWDYVRGDVEAVVAAAHDRGQKVKVIFENCYLADEHKVRLCEICGEVGADWVKTSTGYGEGGATVEDIKLMRAHAPAAVQVKAAGGVRTLDALLEMRALGCTRVGASRTKDMLDECRRRLGT